jgi:hypothetical protein
MDIVDCRGMWKKEEREELMYTSFNLVVGRKIV